LKLRSNAYISLVQSLKMQRLPYLASEAVGAVPPIALSCSSTVVPLIRIRRTDSVPFAHASSVLCGEFVHISAYFGQGDSLAGILVLFMLSNPALAGCVHLDFRSRIKLRNAEQKRSQHKKPKVGSSIEATRGQSVSDSPQKTTGRVASFFLKIF
jgi:hypothetical protein